jgi:hypothetical protein
MTIQALYPDISPSLSLDFANVKQLDPRVTFARASTARYYDGKTVAKAEENLLVRSQEFDNALWAKTRSTVTADTTAAPDGTTTADSLLQQVGQTTSGIIQQAASVVATSYTISIFAKPNGKNFLRFAETLSDGTAKSTWFDVQNGTVGTTASGHTATITASTNGYYRCVIVFTANATRTANVFVGLGDTDGSLTVVDDGTGLFIWGAQLEQRSTVTAYTATTTQPITNYIPVLLSATTNEARFDHNPTTSESLGLLIEEQRTNRLTYSEQFDDVVWSKARTSINPNTVIAPDGTLTGDTYIGNGVSGSKAITQTDTSSATGKTLSVYAKRESNDFIQLLFGADTGPWANFNLLNGTVGSTGTVLSATITPVGNDWFRCSVSTASTTATIATINLVSTSTAGRNESNTLTTGVYLWGAQLEAGAFPTSYIPTVASQVTRSADNASMTGTNFSSWYRQDEGSFFATASIGQGAFPFLLYAGDGTADNRHIIFRASVLSSLSTTITMISSQGGIDQSVLSAFSANSTRFAYGYKLDDYAGVTDLTATKTDISGTVPTVDRLLIGSQTIKKLAFYPKRLTNEQLEAITT